MEECAAFFVIYESDLNLVGFWPVGWTNVTVDILKTERSIVLKTISSQSIKSLTIGAFREVCSASLGTDGDKINSSQQGAH